MKLSAKTRYGLASMVHLAMKHGSGKLYTIASISDELDISKIYLEQVFSHLRCSGLVTSVKGARGGYHLSRAPRDIFVYDIIYSLENSLFEPCPETVKSKAPYIDKALKNEVFDVLDDSVEKTLSKITLSDLANSVIESQNCGYMYYL